MDREKALTEIAGKRWRIALALGALMLTGYFGFILLVAFNKPLLSTVLVDSYVSLAGVVTSGPALSLGILLGAMVILFAQGLTLIYVNWANRVYDPAIRDILAQGDK